MVMLSTLKIFNVRWDDKVAMEAIHRMLAIVLYRAYLTHLHRQHTIVYHPPIAHLDPHNRILLARCPYKLQHQTAAAAVTQWRKALVVIHIWMPCIVIQMEYLIEVHLHHPRPHPHPHRHRHQRQKHYQVVKRRRWRRIEKRIYQKNVSYNETRGRDKSLFFIDTTITSIMLFAEAAHHDRGYAFAATHLSCINSWTNMMWLRLMIQTASYFNHQMKRMNVFESNYWINSHIHSVKSHHMSLCDSDSDSDVIQSLQVICNNSTQAIVCRSSCTISTEKHDDGGSTGNNGQ